jgi:hypothetical protein
MPIAAALLLAGCTTLDDSRLGWRCIGEVAEGGSRAVSIRLLDDGGQFRSGRTEWIKPTGGDMVDVRAEWDVDDGLPEFDRGTFVIRLYPGPVSTGPGQVVLYSDAGRIASAFGTGSIRPITIRGAQLRKLRGRDGTLGVALYNRSGQLMAGSGVEWAEFDRALDLARRADGRSLAASTARERQCQREQRITLT